VTPNGEEKKGGEKGSTKKGGKNQFSKAAECIYLIHFRLYVPRQQRGHHKKKKKKKKKTELD